MSRPTPEQLASSGLEDGEQIALFAEVANMLQAGTCPPELELLHAIPNGGARGDSAKSRAIRGAKLKATGVKRGIPDIFLPIAMIASNNITKYHGLYIELKRPKTSVRSAGTLQEEQEEMHVKLRNQGYCVVTCYGYKEALKTLELYYNGRT